MRSDRILLALLALGGVAHAQDAPPDEPAPPSPPAIVEKPVETPVEKPVETPVAKVIAPQRSPGGAIVALELGVGGVVHGGSALYHAGLGYGVVLGWRWHDLTLEWHLAESYDARADATVLAPNSAGTLDIGSFGVRFTVGDLISVYGGLARVGIPVVGAMVDPDSMTARFATRTVEGMGPIGGIALGWTSDHVTVGVEARVAAVVVGDAPAPYATPTGPAVAGATPIAIGTDGLKPTVATLSATLRFTF